MPEIENTQRASISLPENNEADTIISIINGVGSVFASIGLITIGPLHEQFGWYVIWQMLGICSFCGDILLGPQILKEILQSYPTEYGSIPVPKLPSRRGYANIRDV